MQEKTESEELFEKFCRVHGIEYVPIVTKTNHGEKTRDYDILLNGVRIWVEVKQMDPNSEEARTLETLSKVGTVRIKTEPGHRVRGKIKDAMGKFKSSTEGEQPSILVLYNNVKHHKHTEPFEVLSAMYGEPYFSIILPDDSECAEIGDMKLGGKRKMTKDTNTSVSSIGVLKKNNDGDPIFAVFHNFYAKNPLSPDLISKIALKQYRWDPKKPTTWQEITKV